MGAQILTNVRYFINGADLTADTNKVEISSKREDKDVTNFASRGWRERLAGLGQADIKASGFFEAGSPGLPHDASWAAFGAASGVSICPNGAADQALAYLTDVVELQYQTLGGVGDVAPFNVDQSSTWPLVPGVIAVPVTAPLTATGHGTGNELGAVVAGQAIYAAVHVFSKAGTAAPTVTFAIESDDNSGFTTPTTRLTLNAATAIGGQIARALGPITDTWWRAKWTISGTTPSFLVAVSMGIG